MEGKPMSLHIAINAGKEARRFAAAIVLFAVLIGVFGPSVRHTQPRKRPSSLPMMQ